MFNAWVRPKIQINLPEKTLGWASLPWWWSFAGHPRHEVLWISQSQSGILFFTMNRPWSASSTKMLQYFKVCPECKTPALPMLFKQMLSAVVFQFLKRPWIYLCSLTALAAQWPQSVDFHCEEIGIVMHPACLLDAADQVDRILQLIRILETCQKLTKAK